MTDAALVKQLVIVDRGRRELFELLVTRFAPEPHVRIVFDRRTRIVPPPSRERRQNERRSTADVWDQGYRVATVGVDHENDG
jgi:hypothetical protein